MSEHHIKQPLVKYPEARNISYAMVAITLTGLWSVDEARGLGE